MFIDEVTIEVKAGDGGNGAVAFRREKYVPRGGPSGGNGGSGGSIWLIADEGQSTLLDYRYKREYKVRKGENGGGRDRNGRGSDDLELRVPVGTVVRDVDENSEHYGKVVADMLEHGQRVRIAKGGRGGLGNMNFATPTRQAPNFAQDGSPGEFRRLKLELKLLADVGLVGYPNVGKSTLISRVSAARPKIANYPFTTLAPNLGVVPYRELRSFVMADIPGLIEGAHEGVGLGHRFLKHVERCRVLVHMVDCGGEEGRNPVEDYETILRELSAYSARLAKKPQIVVATKLDITGAEERADELEAHLAKLEIPLLRISAVTGKGLDPLLDAIMNELDSAGPPERADFDWGDGWEGDESLEESERGTLDSGESESEVSGPEESAPEESESDESESDDSESGEPESAESGVEGADSRKSESGRAGSGESTSERSGSGKPESERAEFGKSELERPELGKSGAEKSESKESESESEDSEESDSGIAESESGRSESTEIESGKPEDKGSKAEAKRKDSER